MRVFHTAGSPIVQEQQKKMEGKRSWRESPVKVGFLRPAESLQLQHTVWTGPYSCAILVESG